MIPVHVYSDTPTTWASSRDAASSSVIPAKLQTKTMAHARASDSWAATGSRAPGTDTAVSPAGVRPNRASTAVPTSRPAVTKTMVLIVKCGMSTNPVT